MKLLNVTEKFNVAPTTSTNENIHSRLKTVE